MWDVCHIIEDKRLSSFNLALRLKMDSLLQKQCLRIVCQNASFHHTYKYPHFVAAMLLSIAKWFHSPASLDMLAKSYYPRHWHNHVHVPSIPDHFLSNQARHPLIRMLPRAYCLACLVRSLLLRVGRSASWSGSYFALSFESQSHILELDPPFFLLIPFIKMDAFSHMVPHLMMCLNHFCIFHAGTRVIIFYLP